MLRDKMRWLFYTGLLPDELAQAKEDGKAVRPEEVAEILAIRDEKNREERARAWILRVERLSLPPEKQKAEPETYAGILKTLNASARRVYPVASAEYQQHIRAAWAGRMSGCLLGIPVEGWPSAKISDFLKSTGQDPRKDYLTSKVSAKLRAEFGLEDKDAATPYDRQAFCWKNNMTCFPVDDDTNYTVAALRVLERYGRGFTADNVAESLLYSLPALHACTAERLAYRNLLNCVPVPDCAWVLNPYREWIGAQIRADFFGYICPGQPMEAARMAYQDASVTHVRNGIYAEMYMAALISLAPCGLDALEMIDGARAQIPPHSALATALETLCQSVRAGADYETLLANIRERYDETQWFHWGLALPNALIVTSLLACYGLDHSTAIGKAVTTGFDTDCNAATIGSLVGLRTGALEAHWLQCFEPALRTSVHGYEQFTLEELTERTMRLVKLPTEERG